MAISNILPSIGSISHVCAKLLSSSTIATLNRYAMFFAHNQDFYNSTLTMEGMVNGVGEGGMGDRDSELKIDGSINTRYHSLLMPLPGIQASGDCCPRIHL